MNVMKYIGNLEDTFLKITLEVRITIEKVHNPIKQFSTDVPLVILFH